MKKLLLGVALLASIGANILNAAADDKALLERLQKHRKSIQESIEFEEWVEQLGEKSSSDGVASSRELWAYLAKIDADIKRLQDQK